MSLELYIYFLIFIFGLVWGSFLNMAIYRVKQGKNFSGRSFCDFTKQDLTWKDLIPVVSFVIYKGKCRHCRKKLPLLYPITELITGGIFVIVLRYILSFGYSLEFIIINTILVFIFVLFFIFFAIYDYLYWEVNVKAIKLALIFAVVVTLVFTIFPNVNIMFGGLSHIVTGVIAGFIVFLIVKLTKESGMGEGDIYLMAFAGIFVGPLGLIPLFMISSISGSIIGLVKAWKIKKLRGVQIQFVPFISFASLTVFLFHDMIVKLLYLEDYIYFFSK